MRLAHRVVVAGLLGLLGLVVAACTGSDGGDLPVVAGSTPPLPGSGEGSGSARRVCLVQDLRLGSACATTGVAGLTVALGSSTAETAANGSFAITVPQATNLMFTVTGPTSTGNAVVTSAQQFGAIDQIPVITNENFSSVLASLETNLSSQEGSIVIGMTRNGQPVSDVGLSTEPDTTPFFDSDTTPFFSATATQTGERGTVLVPGLPAGMVAATVTQAGGTPITQNIPVLPQAITFATIDMP